MEDKRKQELTGSPSRDIFKRRHKDLNKTFYACDLDFVLVAKHPYRIVGFLDYKQRNDDVTFSEAIAYNLLKRVAPVFIVQGNAETGLFTIYRFENSDPQPDPPISEKTLVRQCETWADFQEWEGELRG